MKHYIYKITNILNGKYYVGKHSSNCIQKDGYMGSGKHLKNAIKKYGRENFNREILYQFEDEVQAYTMEQQIVNQDFVLQPNTYNQTIGGIGGHLYSVRGKIIVKDESGNIFSIDKDDPRWLNGSVVGVTKGIKSGITVKDQEGNCFKVEETDQRWISGELVGVSKGIIRSDQFKNNLRNRMQGTTVPFETRMKISESLKRCKCTQERKNKVRKFHKNSVWINNNDNQKFVQSQLVPEYLSQGWNKGRIKHIRRRVK